MMTEAEAATIVRRIVARPTTAAFDTASGSIIRLFARLELLENRVRKLERRDGSGRENDVGGLVPRLDSAPRARRDRGGASLCRSSTMSNGLCTN
jgi:hypothetical protein